MISMSIMGLFFFLLLVGYVAADPGDDFSNNLFTDLAPILALFGEQVTMQFMRQAMGWSDCVILAMAPLGILTIIVSAIRVGGPPWLKALIGRATENLAAAEVELMSSTSKEVCELWNGLDVVRCTGSAMICEFICLLPDGDISKQSRIQVLDLQEARDGGFLELKPQMTLWLAISNYFRKFLAYPSPSDEIQKIEEASTSYLPSDILIIRNNSPEITPNISHNRTKNTGRSELRVAACFGVILQIGVLMYCGFVTYYPTLRFEKDGRPIIGYALPLTVIGTVVLNFGMLICCHVVNKSTDDQRFAVGKGRRARMVWLQQRGVVSDQEFDSFALYTGDDQPIITTSSRVLDHERHDETRAVMDRTEWLAKKIQAIMGLSKSDESEGYVEATEEQKKEAAKKRNEEAAKKQKEDRRFTLELEAIFGTVISLTGFFVQFVGVRGMHWTTSVASLGAVLVMTAVRAWVRRGLAKPLKYTSLVPGYELDWFVDSLRDVNRAAWFRKDGLGGFNGRRDSEGKGTSPPNYQSGSSTSIGINGISGDEDNNTYKASILGRRSSERSITNTCLNLRRGHRKEKNANQRNAITTLQNGDTNREQNGQQESEPQKLVRLRKDLAQLPGWRGPASREASQLARAMEEAMNILFKNFSKNEFVLSYSVQFSSSHTQRLNIHLDKKDKIWKARSHEVEAALSLRLFYAEDKQKISSPNEYAYKRSDDDYIKDARNAGDEVDSLRATGKLPEPGLKLLGSCTESLLQHLRWWMPTDGPNLLQVEELDESTSNQSGAIKTKEIAATRSGQLDKWEIEQSRVVGFDKRQISVSISQEPGESTGALNSSLLYFQTMESKRRVFNVITVNEESEEATKSLLAVESRDPLEVLFAKDMFSAFMWHVAESMDGPIQTRAEVQKRVTKPEDAWRRFTLQNDILSRLAQAFQTAGLGSIHDAYLSILPPLSVKEKLPQLDAVVELIQDNSENLEKYQRWGAAGEVYLRLVEYMKAFPIRSYAYSRAAAVLTEFKAMVSLTIGLRMEQKNDADLENIKKLHLQLTKKMKNIDMGVLRHLLALYKFQERHLGCCEADISEFEDFSKFPSEYLKLFNLTESHRQILSSRVFWSAEREHANTSDVLDRTPLHCLVAIQGTHEGSSQSTAHRKIRKALDEDIQSLIDLGADPNACDLRGWTPLHYACWNGKAPAVQALLRVGARADSRGRDGTAPIHCATINDHLDVVKHLLQVGATIDCADASGSTALHLAAYRGHHSIVETLCNHQCRIMRDVFGRASIHLAAMAGHEKMIEFFEQDLNAKDHRGRTVFHFAAENGYDSFIRSLPEMALGADVQDNGQLTPLHLAAMNGWDKVVRQLVSELGAKVNARNADRRTALHLAAQKGHKSTLQVLVKELKAEPNPKDDVLRTPLHVAAQHGMDDVILLLTDVPEVEKEAVDNQKHTPLHLAALKGHTTTVQLMVRKLRADKEARNEFKSTPLHLASEEGHEDTVKALLEMGVDIEAVDEFGRTPLRLAMQREREKTVMLLTGKGADVNAVDKRGRTALHDAAYQSHQALFNHFLEKQGNINAGSGEISGTPLHAAACSLRDDNPLIPELLDRGAKIDDINKDGQKPLHLAAEANNTKNMMLLVARGADIEIKDTEGRTPLLYAAKSSPLKGNKEAISLLLDLKADINAIDNNGETLLHLAAWNKNPEMVKFLVERGVNIEALDNRCQTPLHTAAGRSQTGKHVLELLELGANREATDKRGRTPLHGSVIASNLIAMQLLLDGGANIDRADSGGRTPLLLALQVARSSPTEVATEIITRLLALGANVNLSDNLGWTPLHLAAAGEFIDIARFLIEKGAKLEAMHKKNGATPLHVAASGGRKESVRLLIELQANVEALDTNGRTPLQLAKLAEKKEMVQLLEDLGAVKKNSQ